MYTTRNGMRWRYTADEGDYEEFNHSRARQAARVKRKIARQESLAEVDGVGGRDRDERSPLTD